MLVSDIPGTLANPSYIRVMSAFDSGFGVGQRVLRGGRAARAWFGAGCLLAIAGCGARTSMLSDEDPTLGSSLPAGGSAGAAAGSPSSQQPGAAGAPSGASTAGAPGSGFAGSPSSAGYPGFGAAPSTGGSASGGEAGTSATAEEACYDFCSQVASSSCPAQFGAFPDCTTNCSAGLSQNDACLQVGQAVMACYLPLFAENGGNCAAIDGKAIRKCAPQLKAYEQCAESAIPTPVPVPNPAPAGCSSSGSGDSSTCNLTANCPNGTYYATCQQSGPNQAVCSCTTGNGASAGFSLDESIGVACYDAVSVCGAPPQNFGLPVPK
jgi:hypothetical protein